MTEITASIVAYKTDTEELEIILNCVIQSPIEIVYLVDNSPLDCSLKRYSNYSLKISYISNPANTGFGAAHNMAIEKALKIGSKYHFIVNPDISFKTDVISPMVAYMKEHPEIGMMMPRVLNMDGSCQYLPKLLPSPFDLLLRKLKRPIGVYRRFIEKYELRNVSLEKICNVPIISGCFSLLNMEVIKKTGGYDERFFMYFEDFDLSRRIHENYKTIYFPLATVFHGYEGGANRNWRLFKVFVTSAIKYFNKWGWFYDKNRKLMNQNTLKELGIK